MNYKCQTKLIYIPDTSSCPYDVDLNKKSSSSGDRSVSSKNDFPLEHKYNRVFDNLFSFM